MAAAPSAPPREPGSGRGVGYHYRPPTPPCAGTVTPAAIRWFTAVSARRRFTGYALLVRKHAKILSDLWIDPLDAANTLIPSVICLDGLHEGYHAN